MTYRMKQPAIVFSGRGASDGGINRRRRGNRLYAVGAAVTEACRTTPQDLPLDVFDLDPDEVRRRFDWALRQGHPRWLWPEASVGQWQSALNGIERVTRGILATGRSSEILGDE